MKDTYKVGDEVYIECDSSFGASGCGIEKIEDIRTRFDTITGESYQQLFASEQWFDARNGNAISGPTAYYISSEIDGEYP